MGRQWSIFYLIVSYKKLVVILGPAQITITHLRSLLARHQVYKYLNSSDWSYKNHKIYIYFRALVTLIFNVSLPRLVLRLRARKMKHL